MDYSQMDCRQLAVALAEATDDEVKAAIRAEQERKRCGEDHTGGIPTTPPHGPGG